MEPIQPSLYPDSIAAAIRDLWAEQQLNLEVLPSKFVLHQFVDTVYQASLLREEGDAIQFRAVWARANVFEKGYKDGNASLQVVRYRDPIDFSPHNLRKLAAAADYYRSILGVFTDGEELKIWGTIYTGTAWVSNVQGGKPLGPSLRRTSSCKSWGPVISSPLPDTSACWNQLAEDC